MTQPPRLRLAMQKSGRLSDPSRRLLERSGIELQSGGQRLSASATNFPLDVMLVRDDDIPRFVAQGVCDLGIVGQNVLLETIDPAGPAAQKPQVVRKLGFGNCRLALAVPVAAAYEGVGWFRGRRIATSYPRCLEQYLAKNEVSATVVEISGAVEGAPVLGVADAVCDLVATGSTLRANGLREVETVLTSEAVLIQGDRALPAATQVYLQQLLERFDGVMKAARSKYIMMNAPAEAVDLITSLVPGMEEPTIVPLHGKSGRVALHAVAGENVFWETMHKLKAAGASSILVVDIEKIIA